MQPGGKQGRTSTAKEMEEPALNAWPTEKALVLCCFQCEATNLFQVCTWRQPPSSICTWKQQHFSICTWRQPHILCGGIASTIPKGRRSTSQADTWPVGQGRKEQVCSVLLDSEALSEGAQWLTTQACADWTGYVLPSTNNWVTLAHYVTSLTLSLLVYKVGYKWHSLPS